MDEAREAIGITERILQAIAPEVEEAVSTESPESVEPKR
jgi:hypothetical protein